MAEFALGLTKTAVEGTLVRVKSAIDAEAEIKEKVQNDLVFITEEFEMMRSFLYAANTAERAKNPVVRTWVRQLRKLAFDVEDCVEFVVHLETKKSDWWWRVVPSCIAPPLPVDVAVARIQQLKARVEDISKRNARYNLLGDDNSMPQNQLVPATAVSSSPFGVLSEVWQAAGKLRTTGDLTKLITSEGKDLQVISLWQGSCSTGASHYHHLEATYIIKKAYDDSEICQRFKSRAWIKLMHPFDLDEFLKALLALFYPPTFSNHQSQEQSEELGGAELASHNKKAGAEFRKKMRAAVTEEDDSFKAELMHQVSKERRYLLVLEGVSTVVDWEAIRMYLPDSNNGSRIVVSTEHLRIALLCTREPYQVSQLTRFSDGQFLYAFSKKGSVRRSDIGEFNWQITRGVVISVVGNFPRIDLHGGEISVVPQVYECIRLKRKEFDGVVFEEHSWVDVPRPFDINKFAVVLFLNFQSRGFQAKEIAEVGSKGDQGVIERCCKYLHENDCLVVINGLEARKDWDEIKTTFLSKPTNCTRTKLSIIVVTDDETVAKHCAPDQQNRVFDIKALEQDEVLNRLINKDTGSSRGLEDSGRAPLIYNQRIEAGCWAGFEFDDRRQKELSTLREQLRHPNTSVISVWGRSGVGKSTLVRGIYYEKVIEYFSPLGNFSWADVPHSFDLTDFSWHLLLDFQSTHEEKVAAAAGLMKGQDPIQACRKILHEKKYMVVIDGLQSKQDWDIIRKTFFSELHTQSGSHIIVITNEKSVAKHSVDDKEDQLLKVKPLRDRDSLRLPLDPGFFVGRVKEKRVLTQHQHWSGTFTLVIALWGIAGVGKSALVRNIYKNYKEVGYGGGKQQKMSWVDVPHPFRLMEFSRRLLLGFYSKDLHAQETAAVGIMEGQDTIQACCHFLQQYVCVIVIDGLRSTHDWDSIKAAFLSEPTQSSRIIVITTEETVATHCALDKRRVHNLKGLDAKDALRLFKEIAGGSRRLASKMDRVKLIMAKCGGLPQVIYVIAQEISKTNSEYDPETAMATILGDICDDFMGKLETDPRFNELKDLFSWMQSYFDACSDSLKPCIFYLSIFLADKRIRRRRLLRRWIAEGYSRDTSGGGTAEENGEKLFADLVESSIIQLTQTPSSNDKVDDDVCQVNGFFHEYIISRPMEDNLVFALEGCCSINSQCAGQHLTIRNCWDGDEIVFKSIDFARLRSLTVSGAWRSFFISNDINMELLRVLDLEDTDSDLTDPVLVQIGKQLPRLKFLSVRGCKDITRLPDSLGGLRQLQTLDIRHTKIAILPHSIIKLVKLQYVRAGTNHVMSEGGNAGRPSPDEDDCESTSSEDSLSSEEDGVGTVDSDSLMRIQPPLPASTGGDETSRSQLAASDGDCTREKLSGTSKGEDTSISQSVLAADGEGTSTSQPPPAGDDVTSINYDDTSRRPQDDDRASTTRAPCRSKARNAVVSYSCSWWSKKLCASQQIDGNFGVEAPAEGIGKLTALQTFGVVNVGGAHGKSVLKELKKLTQLRKLGVCGINRENWQDLCCNMLGYGHLKSLSVHLDKDEDGESFFSSTGAMFNSLPKNLKSLKLYTGDGHGNVLVPWVWMKQLGNLSSLTKVNLGLAISTQDDIDSFKEFPDQVTFRHICVKPTQDCELRYYTKYRGWQGLGSQFLKIDCGSYKLVIAFEGWIAKDVEVLVVHCSSTESSLKLSGLEWLESLKEVVLKGPYSEVVKQHLQEQVARTTLLYGLKPVLKLEDGESHQSREPKDPAAPSACCHTCASCCFNGITSTCK
ncbi:hypothetical protein ACQ4PT_029325 [Festuca glaucescens]